MVTLKEIAEKCSVSIATVSNILNGKSNVSEQTRERVLQVVKETGYKPNYMARTLRAHKTNTIGLIVDDLTDFSSPTLIDGLMGYCEKKGYKIVLENIRYYSKKYSIWQSDDDFRKAVEQAVQEMVTIKVDGIIYVASHSRKMDCIPKGLDIPVVISYAYSEEGIPSVLFDDEKAAFDITEYLISKGHEKIALVMGAEDSNHTKNRYNGFYKAMKLHGLQKIAENKSLHYFGNWSKETGYDISKVLLEGGADFTAIFCFNDEMATGVYQGLLEKKLKPGEDISVVGFDNRDVCDYLHPPLTTMKLPLFEIGETSAKVLINLINKVQVETVVTNLNCEFIERESVKKINK